MTAVPSDIEIAQATPMQDIATIAAKVGLTEADLECYGRHKAKIGQNILDRPAQAPGKLILVTAINPTPAGEGKTTVTIGLADALSRLGKRSMVAMREPSLGPVFGVKGGAAGGGYAQVVPMEDINLHFTGDFHAIGAANNLLAAMLDNHIYHGNALNIDPKRMLWRRALDMNDRQLRHIASGLGAKSDGVVREDGFDITVASEVMAIFCLANDLADLKQRLARIIVAYNRTGEPVTAGDLHAHGAMTALLKDAIKPNLVQTLAGTPALVHGGPFANIAHGCNSVIATRLALQLADYTVTEAGFGADLGAEKFLDIKCRSAGLQPDAVVIVATIRALKYNGGVAKTDLNQENLDALTRGLPNLIKHIENITQVFQLPAVVAINRFSADTDAEIEQVRQQCAALDTPVALCEVWGKGGAGGEALAEAVLAALAQPKKTLSHAYDNDSDIASKIDTLARRVYGADGIDLSSEAQKNIAELTRLNLAHLPICVAKTQYSFSDDPSRLGRPQGFRLQVRQIQVSAGAGFLVVLTGNIMKMPGLPKQPAAERIDVDVHGRISGLF